MHVIFFVVGLLVILAGAAMVLAGIPINEFGLGNTLILAGTIAIVGGLLVTGLSAVLRDLRKLVTAREQAPDWPVEIGSNPDRANPAGPTRDVRAPVVPVAASIAAPSIAAPSVAAPVAAPPIASSPMTSPTVTASTITSPAIAAPSSDPPLSTPPAASPTIVPVAEVARRRPRSLGLQTSLEQRSLEMQSERHWREALREATVVKSGVIEGLAYRLYSDGAIEADFAEGRRRFSSIDELQDYLERDA